MYFSQLSRHRQNNNCAAYRAAVEIAQAEGRTLDFHRGYVEKRNIESGF